MRFTFGLLTLCLVSGCAFSPPKPKQCDGEFRPVNDPAKHTMKQLSQACLGTCIEGGAYGLES